MIDDYLQKIKAILNVPCLRAAVYARYSSDLQRSESIDAQLRAIYEFANKHSIVITSEYIDEAKSAKRDNRQEFQKMISESKNCEWHIVLVHKLDRFARNRYDSANYRVILKKNKKYLISATELLDDSPESLMLEAVIEAMAEYYSKNLSREVMKGLTENALLGKHCGGVPPLGYDIQNLRYVINEFEAEAVKLAYKRFLQGDSYKNIINELNNLGFRTKRNRLFSKNSLYEILRNEKYTGTFVYNKTQSRDEFTGVRSRHKYKPESEIIKVENVIPTIIIKEDFEKVQYILDSRKRKSSNNSKEIYLLTGKLICGECGGHFVGNRNFNSRGVKYISYVCNRRYNPNYKCTNGSIKRDWIEDKVLKSIFHKLTTFNNQYYTQIRSAYIEHKKYKQQEKSEALRKKINKIDDDIKRIVDVISKFTAESLIVKLKDLESQKQKFEKQLLQLDVSESDVSIMEMDELIKKANKMLEEKEVPKKELIDLVVNKIVVNKTNVQVYLNCFEENFFREKINRPMH